MSQTLVTMVTNEQTVNVTILRRHELAASYDLKASGLEVLRVGAITSAEYPETVVLCSLKRLIAMAQNRVLIAERNPAIRMALIDLLQEDSEIVATVEDGESVFGLVEAVSPNVILLGVAFDKASGFEIARRLRQSKCPAKIIIVSLHESREPGQSCP